MFDSLFELNILPHQDAWRWFSIAAWLFVGIPHGSLDFYKIIGQDIKSTVFNLSIYSFLFIAAFQLLTLIPSPAFLGLFLLSLYHFGDEAFRSNEQKVQRLPLVVTLKTLWGMGIVLLFIALELNASITIISMYLPLEVASYLNHHPHYILSISVISLGVADFFLSKAFRLCLLHGFAIAICLSFFNFFNGFTLYFTLFHAAPVLARFGFELKKNWHLNNGKPKKEIFTALFILTFITAALLYLLLALHPQYLSETTESYSVVLISFLLSISLPHSLLNSKRAHSFFSIAR